MRQCGNTRDGRGTGLVGNPHSPQGEGRRRQRPEACRRVRHGRRATYEPSERQGTAYRLDTPISLHEAAHG